MNWNYTQENSLKIKLNELGFSFSKDYLMYYGDTRCNFGVGDFAGGTAGAHDFICYMPIPNKYPFDYPIGHYDETEISFDIFASSVNTWGPSFVIWAFKNRWFDDQIVIVNKTKILEFLKLFNNSVDLIPKMDFLFEKIENKTLYGYFNENPLAYEELVILVERDTFIGEFAKLKLNPETSVNDWEKYILKYPFTNKGFIEIFKSSKSYGGISYENLFYNNINPEIAYLAFKRPIYRDFKDSSEQFHVLYTAAKICITTLNEQDPLYDLIKEIADNGENEILYPLFHNAGEKFMDKEDYLSALTCFENAIIYGCSQNEEPYLPAFHKIIELTPNLNDEYYNDFVNKFMEEVDIDWD